MTQGATALVLPGGGARGAYQAGALAAVADLLGRPADWPFRILVGQSAGAVNVAGLAARAGGFAFSAARLVAMWRDLRVPHVYRADAWSVGRRAALWLAVAATGGWATRRAISFLDNAPLRALLDRDLDFEAMRASLSTGALDAVALSASSYGRESGLCVTFFETGDGARPWRDGRRMGVASRLGVDHVMASAALPFLFPAERVGGCWFGDGALRLDAPRAPALALGAARVFVVAARDPAIAPPAESEPAPPSLGALAGHMLDIIFNDSLDADLARLARLNDAVAAMGPEVARRLGLRRVEAFALRPSRDLRAIAGRHAAALPRPIRLLLRGLGAWRGDWRLASYLNFDGGYCSELAALGHADVMAHAGTVRAFLGGAPTSITNP